MAVFRGAPGRHGVVVPGRLRNPWPHRLAVVTATATLLLIFVGGLVTNTGSALAVPDWPTTFGYNMFLYPWSRMVGGIFYEHSHRLIGSAVGILTIALGVSLWLTERRRWVRTLGLVAVVAVVVQGVLGGLRVVLLEQPLAIVHGCLAQAFFALLVSLAVCTSAWWDAARQERPLPGEGHLRTLAAVTAALVYVQIVFGALLTHMGARVVHLLGAALVTAAVGLLAGRVLGQRPGRAKLRRPAVLLLVLLLAQVGLGVGAYLWRYAPSVSASMPAALGLALQTTHRITGAAVLGTAVLLAWRVARLVGASRAMPAHALPAEPTWREHLSPGHGQESTA
ncbi:MAG: heme A synthase [Candidatus Binatia bacterium]